MGIATAARWLRLTLLAEINLLKEAGTIRLPDKASRQRLAEILTNGGLVLDHELGEMQPGVSRTARLLLQMDGDAVLIIPRNFSAHPEDPDRIRQLHAVFSDELDRLRSALPYSLGALIAVVLRVACLGTTLVGAPDVAHLFRLIGQAPHSLAGSVPWWHLAGTVFGLLGLVFSGTIRRCIARGLGWLFRWGMRPAVRRA